MKKIVRAMGQIAFVLSCSSCATQHESLLCDAIRFSDGAKTSYVFDQNSKGPFAPQGKPSILYDGKMNYDEYDRICRFIRDGHQGQATAGYYALDIGLDRVSYMRRNYFRNDPNTRFYIIYVTDGEDNVSGGVAKEHGRLLSAINAEEYAKRIHRKVKRTMGMFKMHQNTFQIYPIRFLGKDVIQTKVLNKDKTDEQITAALRNTMEGFRGASKGTVVPDVIMGEDFKDISNGFQEMFTGMGCSFSVNTGYRGQRIRMLLGDGRQTVVLEGTLKKKMFGWVFEDLSFSEGLFIPDPKSSNKNKPIRRIHSVSKNPTLATFRVDNIKLNDANFKVYSSLQHLEKGGLWMNNSEYNTYRRVNTNAYVLLIMDESSSLGEDFDAAQEAILDMLETIAGGMDD